MRIPLAVMTAFCLTGCAGGGQFADHALWPFGNPNTPQGTSETAQRALGKNPQVPPLEPQPGNVWPGPVQPMPTLSEVEKNSDLPLGQGYTPSLPSPYPPGQGPQVNGAEGITAGGDLYPSVNGAPQPVLAVPGDAR
ncbi:hypothetical protein [Acidocella sp.]|uniref:hypothetical protein n=1 Tax=Acidocella sp. TaxID=50710 RepID=UPI002621DC65|nr:hypothetical protein [Acidocella sp.]